MATVPTFTDVKAYMGADQSWSDAEVVFALNAQQEDQAKKCAIPVDPENAAWFPDALYEALCRRTQVALSLQPLPLGVQITMSDYNAATTRLGSPSKDPLVADLERPFRKLVFG